jgi:hypothetical protein
MPWSTSADKRADPLHYLPPEALHTLASILCYPTSSPRDTQPSRDWLIQQRSRIEALPRSLKLNRSLSLATFFTVDRVVSGRLCQNHRDLKPELVFWCYTQLNEEVSVHVDRYRRYRMRFPGECTDELRDYIDNVTGIATLYLGRDDFEAEYGRHALPEEERHHRVRGGCAACVLSVVGARAQMLIDLRASMLARKKHKTPRLLVLVEAWMDEFPTGTLEMRLESEEIAEELRQFRGRIVKLKGERGEDGGEKHYVERDRERRRRRKQKGVSMGRAIAEFFGLWFGGKKKQKKEKHGSSSGNERSARRDSTGHRDSSSHHGSSTHLSASHSRRDSASRAGSTYSGRPGSTSSHGPQSEYVDRHSSRPVSTTSHVEIWDDGRSSQYSYYDPSYVTAHEDEVPDNATLRGSRYTVSPVSSPRTSAAYDNVSELSSSPSARYSRNPYRQSFSSNLRHESTASVNTIRPEPVPTSPPGNHLHPVWDPLPGQPRYSWTSRCASSIYSTDGNGLREGDAGFQGSGNGYAVRHEPELERVVENLELEEDDVPLDPDGYDEIHCPSSDSEDGEDEAEEEDEYVGARAGWKQPQKEEETANLCPICQGDLSGLTPVEATTHCNACLDVNAAPVPPKRGGRPTVSGIGRMVDEVIDGFGHLSTIDEAAAQFTPRPEVAARVRREYEDKAAPGGRSKERRYSSYAPSSVGMGVPDGEVLPDDSVSVRRQSARSERETRRQSAGPVRHLSHRRSALGGSKFRHVVRDR